MSIHNKSVALVCAGLVVCSLPVGAARAQAVSFEEGQTFEAGNSPQSVATGDFDGDGLPDLVTADGSFSASVLLGDGHGGFGSPSPTIQTSLASLPQTAKSEFPWGNGFRQHQLSALQTRFPPFTVAAMLAGLKVLLSLDGVG